jgi:type II secretory ATPase GspE/PulE/Tfp pilus assembly ATPase PilB-like protein
MEMMPMTQEIRKIILKKGSEIDIEQAALRADMKDLAMSGIEKAVAGITSIDEVIRVAYVRKG